jgi:hypothetical protein
MSPYQYQYPYMIFNIGDNVLFKYSPTETEMWYATVISLHPFIIRFNYNKNSEIPNQTVYPQGHSIMYVNILSCLTKLT